MNSVELGFVLRSALLQLTVFSLIPVIWWYIKGRKKAALFEYFGLFKPKASGRQQCMYAIFIYWIIWIITHLPVFTQYTQPSSNAYSGLGASAILPILIVSFIQQGLSEELLFRGFVNKRLINKLGFQKGNVLQATVFGAMHILFASDLLPLSGIIIFITTFIGGYILGYLSEKSFGGSITFAIFFHGLGNAIVNFIQAFS